MCVPRVGREVKVKHRLAVLAMDCTDLAIGINLPGLSYGGVGTEANESKSPQWNWGIGGLGIEDLACGHAEIIGGS